MDAMGDDFALPRLVGIDQFLQPVAPVVHVVISGDDDALGIAACSCGISFL
jgi:hypothetical protein